MAEHTALPWTVDEKHLAIYGPEVQGTCLADCHRSDSGHMNTPTNTEGAANAAFIVRAVNCHDDLLVACEAVLALGFFGHFTEEAYIEQFIEPVVSQLHAAITKAKGNQ